MVKENRNKHSMKRMKHLLGVVWKEYKISLVLVLIGIMGSAFATVKGTLFLQSLIDDYIVPLTKSSNPDFSSLGKGLCIMGSIYLAGVLCSYMYNRIMVNVSQGTMKKVRIELFHHMESLPLKYFDTHAHGDIMSVYTNDTDTLRQFLSQSLPQFVNSMVSIVSIFFAMLTLNLPLTVITLLMAVIMVWTAKRVAVLSGTYFANQQENLGKVNGYIEEMMSGQKVVKVFSYEKKSLEKFRELNEELRFSTEKANTYGNILMPVIMQMGNVSYVICAIIGAMLAINGSAGLTIGTLVAFLTLNKNFNQPFGQISQQLNSVIMASAGINRIYQLLEEKPEVDEGYVTLVNAKITPDGVLTETKENTGLWAWKHYHQAEGTTTYTELKGNIVFDHVDFGYEDNQTILHDVSLYAREGQKLAFVGRTGAGKTTITNLINRFYDVQDGKIRFDGININKIKKGDLRRSLGMVLQDTNLFTGTVLDNIRYGNLNATDEECMAAAKLANADSFIRRLPDGYDTMLRANGSSLSQGQRQLLSIARAAVADPPVMILDEATSSIDTRTEGLVQKGMDRLMKGRTTFVIAHRLSTVKDSNCIVVLEYGKIIEKGDHHQLLEKKGKYYQLYTGNAIGI